MRRNIKLSKQKIIASILILFLAVLPLEYVEAAPEEGTSTEQKSIENEVLIVYDDAGASDAKSEKIQNEANQSMEDLDITVTETISESSENLGTIVAAEIPEDMDVTDAAEMLMDNEKISYAQPNYIYETLENEVNDPYVKGNKTYYLDSIKIKDAWKIAKCGDVGDEKKVTVAVLDTGCQLNHEDLVGNISDKAYDVYYDEPLTLSSTVNKGDVAGGSNQGHGTHVCGLIAAEANNGIGIAGVSYNATILPVKIFDDNGKGATTATLLEGLKYCQSLIENKEIENLHVINLSVGTYSNGTDDTDILIENQISTLAEKYNVLCVCAGGNGDSGKPLTTPLYPSDFDVCLSVTSLNKEGNNSSWSDYNMSKDISAPGEYIFSTWCFEEASYGPYSYMSGTSMSAPIVSGVCALLWAKDPTLTVNQVKEAITNTAVPVESNATDGRQGNTGSAGAVDAKAALEYISKSGETDEKTSIENAEITFTEDSYTYTGERIRPEVEVKIEGKKLVCDEDYKVGYKSNLNAGTAQIDIQGINNYRGTLTKEFTINKEKISKCTYSISNRDVFYTGKKIEPEVKLYYKGKTIKQGTDYIVAYSDNIDVGKATVTVTGSGKNFTGSGKFYFNILKDNIADLSISLSETSYTYDGEAKRPSVIIKNGDITLTNGIDYSLIYTDNVQAGTAKVKIIGIGDHYFGSVEKTFIIYKSDTESAETSGSNNTKRKSQKDGRSSEVEKNEEGNLSEDREVITLLEEGEEEIIVNQETDIADEENVYSTVGDVEKSDSEESKLNANNDSIEDVSSTDVKTGNAKIMAFFLMIIIVIVFLFLFFFVRRKKCFKEKNR